MKLTKYEYEIMQLLWETDAPVTRSDIITLSESSRTWKASSIHIFLNSLLEKGAIEVAGFTKTGKRYGRTYAPAITEAQYAVSQIQSTNLSPHEIYAALISTTEFDDELRAEVIRMVNETAEKKD